MSLSDKLVRDHLHTNKFPKPVESESNLIDSETYLGLEVETENAQAGMSTLDASCNYWRVEQDGSLKSPSPYEFVFAQPLAGKQVDLALDELESVCTAAKCKFPMNTSVHVHMNVGDLTMSQLRRLLYLSIVTESALIQYSGGRWNNIFCIPWALLSPNSAGQIGRMFDSGENYFDEAYKYMDINPAALNKYGTIEYRTMKGTASQQEITDWINVLLALKRAAVTSRLDPREDVDYIASRRDVVSFLCTIWDRKIVNKMLHPDIHEHMVNSTLIARMGLFYKDHQEYLMWSEEFKPTKKKVPKYLQQVFQAEVAEQMFTEPSEQDIMDMAEIFNEESI